MNVSLLGEESPSRAPLSVSADRHRVRVDGKFLFVGDDKFFVKGVSYGAFRPDEQGIEYQDRARIEKDFAQMAASRVNTVRIPHTMPPRHLLDIAQQYGLKVMVGLSAEQYVGYLIDTGKKRPDIHQEIRNKVQAVAGHPALLCYTLGNEIPAPYVRWVGRTSIEKYLRGLYAAVKEADPDAIVSYVNYPTTEYLDLSFLDLLCFNVYLEARETLVAYLSRLQNLAGDRPLIMSEVGLDSMRHGEDEQAQVLDWQIRTAFESGCAGVVIFSWTDEWFRGGGDVEDWAFGITGVNRDPKPALAAVRDAFCETPFSPHIEWPSVSVIVCTYNGAKTLGACLKRLGEMTYPNFEVILVNDGSTDASRDLADASGFQVISTENRGLSAARNTGLYAATGDIVAYTDDDACPDVHWLHYLSQAFTRTDYQAIGGPNIAPPDEVPVAACVANAPGGPRHVLTSDTEAEHIPGCNMAFWRETLESIGGFDERFRIAGDDVDVCWRMQAAGFKIGFCPAAMVWHRGRDSIKAFWKQQYGYGKAEARLEEKWPEKYNHFGHVSWGGRIYGAGLQAVLGTRYHVYHGTWGTAPFQSLHQEPASWLLAITATPDWWLVIAGLASVLGLGLIWHPFLWVWPFFVVAVGIPVIEAWQSAGKARFNIKGLTAKDKRKLRRTTAVLYILHGIARLSGRIRYGLYFWRRRLPTRYMIPFCRKTALFTEDWIAPEYRLERIETCIARQNGKVTRNSDYETWDLHVQGGGLGSARMLMAIEDQGSGSQYVRVKSWPVFSRLAVLSISILLLAAVGSVFTRQDWGITTLLSAVASLQLFRALGDCSTAQASILGAVKETGSADG